MSFFVGMRRTSCKFGYLQATNQTSIGDSKDKKIRNWVNNVMSWSFVTLSGKFCKKRILLGGRYSSGICTFGRLGAGTAEAPSTEWQVSRFMWDYYEIDPLSAAIRFARNFRFNGFVYRVVSNKMMSNPVRKREEGPYFYALLSVPYAPPDVLRPIFLPLRPILFLQTIFAMLRDHQSDPSKYAAVK